MVADSKKDWKKADSFYETAVGLTTTPSGTLNNWGLQQPDARRTTPRRNVCSAKP